jgi:hypothetical protein
MESVYSAVRTGYLNKAVCAWALKGFYNRDEKRLQRGTDWYLNKAVCAWVLQSQTTYT